MSKLVNPVENRPGSINDSIREWLASKQGRFVILAVVLYWSFPPIFSRPPGIGLDSSWLLSMQTAVLKNKVFGRDFVMTYGPLGYLLVRALVSKTFMLLFDLFVGASLFSMYRALLLSRPTITNALTVVGLAIVTEAGRADGASSTAVFVIFIYWLWRTFERGDFLSVAASLFIAIILFFAKINYGFVITFIVFAFAFGMTVVRPQRKLTAVWLVGIYALSIPMAAKILRVYLPDYLRSSAELISGYNEAMSISPSSTPISLILAFSLLLAMAVTAYLGRRTINWRSQVLILPMIALAAFLQFKNGFVRSDFGHNAGFFLGLPLLLALWVICWSQQPVIKTLLIVSLIYPFFALVPDPRVFGLATIARIIPLQYIRQAASAPWQESPKHLQQVLVQSYPNLMLPKTFRSTIGQSSVDVMPSESSIAILNNLNYRQRPVPQSYTVYTRWLDAFNVRFIASTNAPDYILYTGGECQTIDHRPASWDESTTRKALLENYILDSDFELPLLNGAQTEFVATPVFLMKRIPGLRRFKALTTNQSSIALNQWVPLSKSTNLLYLTANVKLSLLGRFRALVVTPPQLSVSFRYEDGSVRTFRAIQHILQSGVLVNYQVESSEEIKNWLALSVSRNPRISSFRFTSRNPSAFEKTFPISLTECKFVKN